MIQARSPSATTAATAAPICFASGNQEGGTDGINSPSGRFGSRGVITGSFEMTPPRRVGAFRLVAPTFDGRSSAREVCLPAVPVFAGVGIWPGGVNVCREDAGACRDGPGTCREEGGICLAGGGIWRGGGGASRAGAGICRAGMRYSGAERSGSARLPLSESFAAGLSGCRGGSGNGEPYAGVAYVGGDVLDSSPSPCNTSSSRLYPDPKLSRSLSSSVGV